MKIRFYNARILPLDGKTPLFYGELHTDGDTIAYLGDKAPEAGATFAREIDCQGNLLLPGFKNAHTHSGMTFLRSRADDLPLQEWLNEQVFPMEAKLTPADTYALTKLAILEYLTSGITCMFDMYFFRDSIARAAVDTGFRTVLVGCANDYGGSAQQTADEYERFHAYDPLVTYQLGFHAEHTTSEALLRDIASLIQAYKLPAYTHLNETAREVEDCVARTGLRPIERLDKLGFFDYGGGGYHCVHVSENEMEILKAHGMYVISCPASNAKLASGIAPLTTYLSRGIPVALGTDGPASNNCLDMFREMFLATALQKLLHGADALDANTVLEMACSVGARACGLPQCDCLAVGKQADLIEIDLQQPNMQPLNNPEKNLVYSGSKQNVLLTMIAGRILYENGSFFIGEEPQAIYAAANRIISRMQAE